MSDPISRPPQFSVPRAGDPPRSRSRVVVIGGGIGGLVTGAVLARAGVEVTLLEAQAYLGGCAGTFYRQAYRFDAGATIAAGFEPGGPMQRFAQWLGVDFDARLSEQVMTVHMPGRPRLELSANRDAWRARRRAHFGPAGDAFWAWQERAAGLAWSVADPLSSRPAFSGCEWLRHLGSGCASPLEFDSIAGGILGPVAARLPPGEPELRRFVDGLLQVSARTTSERVSGLHGAAALDFPWRGVAHLRGGMGGIAETLCEAIRRHGGRVLLRRRATKIVRERGVVVAVETETDERFAADQVVANLTPWDLRELLDPAEGALPEVLARLGSPERDLDAAWGTVVVHAGVDEEIIDPGTTLHHQILLDEGVDPGGRAGGIGRTVTVTVSPAWDDKRAPAGKRAVTISAPTELARWWDRLARDPAEYAFAKATCQDHLLAATERAIPGFRRALDQVWSGTPVTYAFYTGRARGWVGAADQTGLGGALSSDIDGGLRIVGDVVHPGQSTLAVVLSSLRVAGSMLPQLHRETSAQAGLSRG